MAHSKNEAMCFIYKERIYGVQYAKMINILRFLVYKYKSGSWLLARDQNLKYFRDAVCSSWVTYFRGLCLHYSESTHCGILKCISYTANNSGPCQWNFCNKLAVFDCWNLFSIVNRCSLLNLSIELLNTIGA